MGMWIEHISCFVIYVKHTFESIGPNILLLIEFFLAVSGAGEGLSGTTLVTLSTSSSSSSESADKCKLEETFVCDRFRGLGWV